ncbi:unnamed protein product, partial [Cuscuta europaea]
MDRRSVMSRAKAKVAAEQAAKDVAKLAAEIGAQPTSGQPSKPPTQPKKKRQADDGQKKLTEAGMQHAKKSKRASPLADADVGAVTMPDGDVGGSNAVTVVDLVSAPSSTVVFQPPPTVQDSRKKRAGKELVTRTYKLEVEYPVKGGVFNEVVDGHDVISQVVPVKDRAYLDKLGNVRIYDGGMDLVVQGTFMLMESHKRQQQEIARLKKVEQKAASPEEAMSCLDRLRSEVEDLKKRADEADAAYRQVAADRDDVLTKLASEKEAREADRLRADEVERAKAEAEKAAD